MCDIEYEGEEKRHIPAGHALVCLPKLWAIGNVSGAATIGPTQNINRNQVT